MRPNIDTPECFINSLQYFKSIEMVANENGFQQRLPKTKKRDSLVEGLEATMESKFHLTPHEHGATLEVPSAPISRSSSPVLEAMSARIVENETKKPPVQNVPDDVPLLCMGARVTE